MVDPPDMEVKSSQMPYNSGLLFQQCTESACLLHITALVKAISNMLRKAMLLNFIQLGCVHTYCHAIWRLCTVLAGKG